jgi:hypothetical protein
MRANKIQYRLSQLHNLHKAYVALDKGLQEIGDTREVSLARIELERSWEKAKKAAALQGITNDRGE